ncbi:hypothetical protein [Streptomyces melanogenes]|uniref:hypothetical protein n=1 Tax=Streptomyces melanogenes TaxID=67326 RepID=UPI00167ECF9F|nr:hypothetical protein [Streptomyces melanogenes]
MLPAPRPGGVVLEPEVADFAVVDVDKELVREELTREHLDWCPRGRRPPAAV